MSLVLCRILINQHAQFRKQCNAFFIDLVSTVCFKDNSPPCPAVILHLLSFLMVEANTVPILSGRTLVCIYTTELSATTYFVSSEYPFFIFLIVKRQTLTKVLSPFDDSVDKNPVVRSVVLKLLLKYR